VSGTIQIQPYLNGVAQTNIAAGASNTGSLSWTIPSNYPPGTTYKIGISAMSGTVSDFSDANFTITAPTGPSLLGPDPGASINFPAADLNGHTILFSWSPVAGTDHYELLADNNSGFGSPEINDTNPAGTPPKNQCRPASATSCTTPSNFLEQNLYYWKVRSCPASGPCSDWSETRTFTITYDDYPAPVFVPWRRFYHTTDRDHYYTSNSADNPASYQFEKIEGYVSDRPFPGKLPLMRLYHPTERSHRYVTSGAKRDSAIAAGYRYEGIAGFIYASAEFGTVGLYHLYKGSPDYDDFLCTTKAEIDLAKLRGYADQNADQPIGYVSPNGLANPLGHRRMQGSIGGVDSATGAFRDAYSQDALAFHGYGPTLTFVLHYNSQSAMAQPIATGWTHSLYAFVVEGPSGEVVVKWGDGSESFFIIQGSSYIAGDAGNYDTLNCVGYARAGCISDPVNKGYNLIKKDQTLYRFREVPINNPPNPNLFIPSVVLVRVEDRYGNPIDINYLGDSGRIDWARDAAHRYLNFTYDPQGRLSQVTDPQTADAQGNFRKVRIEYDGAGSLQYFYDARGNRTTFTYDSDNRLKTVTRPRGNKVTEINYEATGSGRVQSILDGFNHVRLNFAYDVGGIGGLTRLTVPGVPNRRIDTSHDRQGVAQKHLMTGITDAYGNTGSLTLPVATAPDPTLPSQVQDLMHNPATGYTYDGRGNVLGVTDARGKTATFSYDAYNNLTNRTDFGSPTRTTNYVWDLSGKTLMDVNVINDSGTLNTHLTYNAQGLPISQRNGIGNSTGFGYDSFFNLATITDSENNTTHQDYDLAGRLIAVTDPKLKTVSYKYDLNDNLVEVKDHDQHVVNLSYDANNNLQLIAYVRGGVQDTIGYTYDSNDRLETATDPWGGMYRYTYSDAGDLVSRTDPKGQVTTYTYDNNGRLQLIAYQPAGQSVQFGYDANGNLMSMDESWVPSSHVFVYDVLNRLTSHTNPYGMAVQYGYDDASNRTSLTYPGTGKVVTYGYDLAKRLISVSDWASSASGYGYDAADNLTSITNPNGTRTTFSYDRASRLTHILHQKSDLSSIASLDYILDAVGNHDSETATGVLPLPASSGSDTTSVIGKDNRLQSSSDGFGYTYDANGNRIGTSAPAGSTTYTYDSENRLVGVSGPGIALQNVYDGLGNRIAKTDGATSTRYVLDLSGEMSEVLAETDGSNNVTGYYTYGNGLLAMIAPSGQRYVYHADSRGSTLAITDAAQNLVNRYAYDEFGAVASEQVSIANAFKYVGQSGVMAEANGLQFMRARFYDEQSGRFLSRDAIGFAGGDWNQYAYASNRPIVATDAAGFAENSCAAPKRSSAASNSCVAPPKAGAPLNSCSAAPRNSQQAHDIQRLCAQAKEALETANEARLWVIKLHTVKTALDVTGSYLGGPLYAVFAFGRDYANVQLTASTPSDQLIVGLKGATTANSVIGDGAGPGLVLTGGVYVYTLYENRPLKLPKEIAEKCGFR
jgi:RHS repeat-associated protein